MIKRVWNIGKRYTAVVLLVTVLLCLCGGARESRDPVEESVTVDAVWEGREERVLSVCATPSLTETSRGRVAVLLLKIEVPAPHSIADISLGEGACGMVLTVSYGEEGRVACVLLDGIPTGEAGEILRVTTSGEGTRDLRICGVENEAESYLYCMNEDGGIMTYPLVFPCKEGSIPPLDTGEGDTCDEVTQPEIPTDETEDRVDPTPDIADLATFLGCQETAVDRESGQFSVRFLFRGDGIHTPVLCLRGRGSLTVETGIVEEGFRQGSTPSSSTGEAWRCCTFRGLLAEEEYRFFIMTHKGGVTVRYENGKFAGYARD